VTFYLGGSVLLGAATFAGPDANHAALFTYGHRPDAIAGSGRTASHCSGLYNAGAGFSSSTSSPVVETVTPATLTVTGIMAGNKVYDATIKATLTTASAALAGVARGEMR